jgi:HlyD family secretion protein
MSKKLIWITASIVALVLLMIVLQKKGVFAKDKGIKVTAEKVQRRTIVETVTASGKVYPEVEVKISPDISGEIIELTKQEGDSVKRGEVLARIYADIYATQKDQAAAAVNQQQALVGNSSATLDALQSAMQQTESQYNRQQQLLIEKIISKAEFEQAENAFRSAKANYNAALKGIKGNQAGVQSARASLVRANKDLGRTIITSPMNGVVSLLNVKKGEKVAGNSFNVGTEMMRIADMSKIEVRVDVSENDIPKVQLGDSALIEVDAYNKRKFKGIVTQIASTSKAAASTASSSISTDVTNYEVRIRLLPDSYKDLIDTKQFRRFPFRPGMTASADIQTDQHENLSVPINAATTREKGSDEVKNKKTDKKPEENNAKEDNPTPDNEDLEELVFVIQPDNTIKRVKVKLGIQDINYIEIVEGLKAGDLVVTGPYGTISKILKKGDKVNVVKKDDLFGSK